MATVYRALFSNFGKIITNRWSAIGVNLAIILIGVLAIRHFYGHFDGSPAGIHELCDALTGIGVLLIGWGVVLEERHTLLNVFDIGGNSESQSERVNYIFNIYGVGQLIIGLVSEIIVELVKLPNEIFNTYGIEKSMLFASSVILFIGFLLLLKFSFILAVLKNSPSIQTTNEIC